MAKIFLSDPPTFLKERVKFCVSIYRLEWDLEGLEEDLEESKLHLRQMIADSDLVVIETYGKAVPKKCRLSPDGWFQVWGMGYGIPNSLSLSLSCRWQCSWLTIGSTKSLF